jgi:serine/threonine protein kinase
MASNPLIGYQLANFRVEHLLGRGGMAEVYYGTDVMLDRPVAIKVIDARYRGDVDYVQRLIREASSIATWRHENIVQIYYADNEHDLYYYVMEYIKGLDLTALMKQYAADGELMPHDDVLRIGKAVASALDYAHERGIIHRDVKPSNVMVAVDDRVVLADFGLAMNVQDGSLGEVFGTPHYISPEQGINSAAAVPQSDLYSLGVMLYEMLTGAVPFDEKSPAAVVMKHLSEEPPPPRDANPALNERTEAVLLKALHKEPSKRYPSGYKLMNALKRAINSKDSASNGAASSRKKIQRMLSDVSVKDRVAWYASATLNAQTSADHPDTSRKVRSQEVTIPRQLERPRIHTTAPQKAEPQKKNAPARKESKSRASRTFLLLLMIFALVGGFLLVQDQGLLGTAALPPSEPIQFTLYFNDGSLHLHNDHTQAMPNAPLAFERLDAAGNASHRFDGTRWSEFSETTLADWCVSINVFRNPPYLEPPECGNRYNSTLQPTRSVDFLFWRSDLAGEEFRVLWNGYEIGRCLVAAGECAVAYP